MALGKSPSQIVASGDYPLLQIAPSWERVALGEIATVQNGAPFSSEYFTHGEGLPLIRIRDVSSDSTENFYSGPYAEEYVVNKGDLLVGMDGDFKAALWRGPRGLLNQRVCRITPKTKLYSSEFLFIALQPYLNAINAETSSVTVKHLSSKAVAEIPLPLPPLAEQKRIVAKIEELFSELEAGEASLRLARRQLGVYRQALLQQAFEGKLTRCRKAELVPLRDLITGLSQGWSPKCELNRAPELDEWAIIKTTAIQHCRYDDSEAKPLPPPFEPRPSIEIKDGDFLMTRKGPRARAGVSCYVRKTRPLLMVCDTVYRFRCNEAKVHPLYLELALNSPDVLRAIDRQKAGISESGLSLTHTKIGTVEIPLCSLPEQQEIVRLLDAQFEGIERNEREIDGALRQIEPLRQAILQKAFTGCLVPQDPSDEPASTLLVRLRAEQIIAFPAKGVIRGQLSPPKKGT